MYDSPSAEWNRSQAVRASKPVSTTSTAMAPMEREAQRPEFLEFLARQQQSAMLSQNKWKPLTTPSATLAEMSPEEREKLVELPTHTFTMTDFESDRVRQSLGGVEGLLTTYSLTPYGPSPGPLERVTDPVYSRELSWEQYDKLPEAEKAVIDFNSDFLAAREKDLKNQETYKKTTTPEQREKYDTTVTDMFGQHGGSETYAPNVVSLLAQVDLDAMGQDLDEYLNLDRLITADEIKDLPAKLPEPKSFGGFIGAGGAVNMEQYKAIRTDENLAALDVAITEEYARKIEQVMRDGYLRLQEVQASMESARSQQTLSFGGVGYNRTQVGFPAIPVPGSVEATTPPDMFLTMTPDQQLGQLFRAAYEFSLDKRNTDNSQLWTWLEENKVTPAEQDKMWEYINTRLEQDKEYGVPELIRENVPDLRTPAEAERFLGMVK